MKQIKLLLLLVITVTACKGQPSDVIERAEKPAPITFSLADYYTKNAVLDSSVEALYQALSDSSRLAQMIVTSAGELGMPQSHVLKCAEENLIGGVIFLKGSKTSNKAFIDQLNDVATKNNTLPLLFSIDAEPSLYNRRVIGSELNIPKTITIKDAAQAYDVAQQIDGEIIEMGFQQNYAPVVDLSPNNEAIKDRSFGSNADTVVEKAIGFIKGTQDNQVVATAKHFPGHGYVKGDTHKQSVYIDGELRELDVYKPIIKAGVLSIMVAHVTVKNNEKYGTDGLPSTCSRVIVTDLLRNELGFDGIIVTDAMNMMAAVNSGESGPLKAALAGCDMILMPPSEKQLIGELLTAQATDVKVQQQFEASVKRILRLKLCLNMID